MEQGVRILTVSMISTSNTYDERGRVPNVPYIRLQGKWLQKLGFNIGDRVVVITEGGDELRLKLVKDSCLTL